MPAFPIAREVDAEEAWLSAGEQSRRGSELSDDDAGHGDAEREEGDVEGGISRPVIPLRIPSSSSERTYLESLSSPLHTTFSTPSSSATTIIAIPIPTQITTPTQTSTRRHDSTSLTPDAALGRHPQTSIPLHNQNLNGFYGLLHTMAPARDHSHSHEDSRGASNADRYVSYGRGGVGNLRSFFILSSFLVVLDFMRRDCLTSPLAQTGRLSDFTEKSTPHNSTATANDDPSCRQRRRSSLWSMSSSEHNGSESRRASIVEMARNLFHGRRESGIGSGNGRGEQESEHDHEHEQESEVIAE